MKWRKLKHFLPEIPEFTHAAMPTYHEGRIYFSPRDPLGRSHIYSAKLDMSWLTVSDLKHELSPGEPGEFDDAGAMVSYVRRENGIPYIYYIGWNLGVSIPFRNAIGQARAGDKLYGPILDRSLLNPCGVGSCWEGTRWYLSVLGWRGSPLKPKYHIVNGNPHSIAITFKDETEYAIARPCVLKPGEFFGDGLYRMWYCYRGDQYRIGYAESRDGIGWARKDDGVGIDVSESGFDNEAVCYPCVFADKGSLFMLYNGNEYGRTGFGLAVLDV